MSSLGNSTGSVHITSDSMSSLVLHVILGRQQAPANVDDEAALIGPRCFGGRLLLWVLGGFYYGYLLLCVLSSWTTYFQPKQK